MYDRIRAIADETAPWLVEIRRQIHRWPELPFTEERTAGLVADTLEGLGMPHKAGIGKTGVVGVIERAGTKCFGIRTDMDALPIQEETGLEFASERPGIMHACGHDCNTTMGLGAAMILSRLREELPGSVKFVFQPAEEGEGGAKAMIEDGVLEDPAMDAIVAAHVDGSFQTGRIGLKTGIALAGADEFSVRVIGLGAHAAHPDEAKDPVVAAAQAVLALQTIVSRRVAPSQPAVVTVAAIHGGEAFNVIPQEVELRGTVRTRSDELRERMPGLLEEVIGAAVGAHGCTFEIRYKRGAPMLRHDGALTELTAKTCRELLGEDAVAVSPGDSMGAEDFSWFAEQIPATALAVGAVAEGQEKPQGHHPKFMVDEGCLPVGAAALAAVAWAFLSTQA